MIVNARDIIAWEWLSSIIAWCAQVTVIPDDKRIIVFNKGTWKGLNGLIPVGGQFKPISAVGASLLWKNAQKNEKKNKTSEVINRIIPKRSPLNTTWVCSPWKAPSRLISRHHWQQVILSVKIPKINKLVLNSLNHFTTPDTIMKAAIAPTIGQGLWSTK